MLALTRWSAAANRRACLMQGRHWRVKGLAHRHLPRLTLDREHTPRPPPPTPPPRRPPPPPHLTFAFFHSLHHGRPPLISALPFSTSFNLLSASSSVLPASVVFLFLLFPATRPLRSWPPLRTTGPPSITCTRHALRSFTPFLSLARYSLHSLHLLHSLARSTTPSPWNPPPPAPSGGT